MTARQFDEEIFDELYNTGYPYKFCNKCIQILGDFTCDDIETARMTLAERLSQFNPELFRAFFEEDIADEIDALIANGTDKQTATHLVLFPPPPMFGLEYDSDSDDDEIQSTPIIDPIETIQYRQQTPDLLLKTFMILSISYMSYVILAHLKLV